MSDLAAAATALGIPEELASRSAAARAAANGTSADEVLSVWAGGGSAVAPAAPAAAPEPAAAAASAPEPAPSATEEAVIPQPAARPEIELAPAAVMVDLPEPVDAAPLGDRVGVAGRAGAAIGVVAAILVALFSSSWMLPRSGASEVEGGFDMIVEVVSGWVIVGSALIGIAVGLAIAASTRVLAGLADPGMRLVSSSLVTAVLGAVSGGLFGALIGAVVVGAGNASDLDPAIQVVPVLGSLLTLVIGWAIGGWVTAALVQSLGVPAGVDALESEESTVVRRRLVSAYAIPAAAALAIALFVIPLALIFIQFPSFAPLLAGIVSLGILGFASLSASRPGMRISTGEFIAAAAGIGVVLLIIVSVLLVQGGGHGHEEDEAAGIEQVGGEPEAALRLRFG